MTRTHSIFTRDLRNYIQSEIILTMIPHSWWSFPNSNSTSIPDLNRNDAKNLCKKFGEGVGIAGNFEEKEDFDVYYDALNANKKYLEECGYFDNGRITTWLPYKVKDRKLIHEITDAQLLNTQVVCWKGFFGLEKLRDIRIY